MGSLILATGTESASLLSTLAGNVTTIMTGLGAACTAIVDNELTALSLSFFFVGGLFGLVGRALKRS